MQGKEFVGTHLVVIPVTDVVYNYTPVNNDIVVYSSKNYEILSLERSLAGESFDEMNAYALITRIVELKS